MATSEALRAAPAQTTYVVRFDVHQRIQHVLMLSSFIVLAVTGLVQKFADTTLCQQLIGAFGGMETTQLVHHAAAWVMILDGGYHFAYLLYTIGIRGRLRALQMIPSLQDFRDLWRMSLYFFGLSPSRPRFGRFSYLEKFDYWAVTWGMIVMGGSGLVLMFPVIASRTIGSSMITVAMAAHSDEAVLAVGWICLVHLFYAHLAPSIFPFNTAIFTGKVPLERYREEHPLEMEATETPVVVAEALRVVRQAQTQPTPEQAPSARQPGTVASESPSHSLEPGGSTRSKE